MEAVLLLGLRIFNWESTLSPEIGDDSESDP